MGGRTEQSGGFRGAHYPGSTAPFRRSLARSLFSAHKRCTFFFFELQFLEEHIHTGLEKKWEPSFPPHQICVKASEAGEPAIGWRGSHPSVASLMHQQSLGEPLRQLGACVDLNASGGNKLGL